ncbi:MAG: acylneuraminate cytidylyltransferase family protein [Balneola sp.]|nr:acylneuraminate cytidylyltransferase family protein [Balneola sp.]
MKKIVAVIPVRKGSQRVKDKNFKPFAGKSLLEHKLETVKKLPIDEIIINTDSDEAIEMAKKEGVSYHKREPYYASSVCTNSEYHEYLAKVTLAENIIIAQVTEPMISLETFEDAIDNYYLNDCNSLMSVKVVKEFLWHENKPINYSLDNAPNSQNLPEYFAPTFGLVIVNRDAMLESKNFICSNPYFYELNEYEAVDIDTDLDFEFAEFLFKKYRLKN